MNDNKEQINDEDSLTREIAERFNILLDKAGAPSLKEGRATFVANEAGASKQTAANWINGDNPPSIKHLRRLSEKFRFSIDWLVNNVGSMLLDDEQRLQLSVDGTKESAYIVPRTSTNLPQAGNAAELQCSQVVDYIALRKDWFAAKSEIPPGKAMLVEMWDDTMSPTLTQGDVAIVDTSVNYVDSNGMYCIREVLPNGMTYLHIRMVYRALFGGGAMIKCDNERYKEDVLNLPTLPQPGVELLPPNQSQHERSLRIAGKVRWTLKKTH